MTSTTPLPSELPRRHVGDGLAVWQGGAGPSLLLLHGVGLRAEAWRPLLPLLTDRFSVTAVDMPGHGASALLADETSGLGAYVNALEDVFELLDGPVTLVGHSMGAMIAIELASRHRDDVSALVAVNAVFDRPAAASAAVKARVAQVSDGALIDPTATVARWFGSDPAEQEAVMAANCSAWLRANDPVAYRRAYATFANEGGPSKQLLATLEMPALFITGADDPNSTPDMSRAMAAHVPKGRAVVVDHARHMLPMTHAETLARAVIDHSKSAI
ncbi:MAG: alpha/beta hydrolase [Pseudomonadota bacterium]